MQITGINNGSLKEIMSDTLQNLRNADEDNYLTSKIKAGDDLKILDTNKRGFVVGLDYTTNASGGFMNPAGGNLATTSSPALDRMTANYQYVQFGQEIDNENLANSKTDLHVGASAKALASIKALKRRMEFEEWYFCRGDGSQIQADITAGSSGTTLTCAGSRDGAGTYMLRVGQVIRIYDVTLTTLKGTRTITAKTSNTAITVNTSITVVDTDVILPESDSTAPTTTGIKGLPYLVKSSGAYFDKSLSTVPALQAVTDSVTTTFTRTTMEYLYRRSRSIRNGGKVRQTAVTSPAQMSNYYTQFYAQSGAQVNIVGGKPNVDLGDLDGQIDYTFWGQKIEEYKFIHPKFWFNLDKSSFVRLTMKEAGAMLTPAGDFVQKIASGAYANAQQKWDDDYLEYLSVNPAKNSAFTALTFSGLPLLANDPFVG